MILPLLLHLLYLPDSPYLLALIFWYWVIFLYLQRVFLALLLVDASLVGDLHVVVELLETLNNTVLVLL